MTLYFRDYEKRSIKQEVEITDLVTGKALDKQVVENFTEGCYKSWKIQGYVKVAIRSAAGFSCISGVFFDPLQVPVQTGKI